MPGFVKEKLIYAGIILAIVYYYHFILGILIHLIQKISKYLLTQAEYD